VTIHRPIVDTNGRSYATFDLWWAEVERIATERHGPLATRYKKAPTREVFTRNTWSDESPSTRPDDATPASGSSSGLSPVRDDPELASSVDSVRLPAAPEKEGEHSHLNNQTERSGDVANA